MFKSYISEIDDSVLKDLFYAGQFALNDLDTQKRVSAETGLSEERVDALTALAIELSLEQKPTLASEVDVEKEVHNTIVLKEEFPAVECGFEVAGPDPYPWTTDEIKRDNLAAAGWRYARLIGVVRPDTIDEIDLKELDSAKYPHFIKKDVSGQSLWGWSDSIDFVHALTGYEKSICEAWLDFDWGDRGVRNRPFQ